MYIRTDWNCVDCRVNTRNEYYMLHNYLWFRYACDVQEHKLCIGCFEKRLGHKLKKTDFIHAYINDLNDDEKSERLKNRLTVM